MKAKYLLFLILLYPLSCKSNKNTEVILPPANHQLCQALVELRDIEMQLELNKYWFTLPKNETAQYKGKWLFEKSYYQWLRRKPWDHGGYGHLLSQSVGCIQRR